MRIGLIIEEFQSLPNWQLRIIDAIRKHSRLEIGLVIQDLRPPKSKCGSKIGTFLLETQIKIEKNFFFKPAETVNKAKIIHELKAQGVPSLKMNSLRGAPNLEYQDMEVLKNAHLDALVNLSSQKIEEEIVQLFPFGMLTLRHNKDVLGNSLPYSFWELLKRSSTLEVIIEQTQYNSRTEIVLDRAFFNPHWSVVRSDNIILEGSVSLFMKTLENLSKRSSHERVNVPESLSKQNGIGLIDVSRYCLRFYFRLFQKFSEAIYVKIFGWHYQCWTLFIGQGSFLESDLFKLKPMKLPKNEFWADPFLFKNKRNTYVFFETYCYKAKKGKISCGLLENGKLINVQDVLERDYHLSYPFIFEDNGEIYLMPETVENKRLEVYKCVRFPDSWELYTTAFEGEMVADAFFYRDFSNQNWLFVNKKPIESLPLNTELYIYRVDSVKLEVLEPHAQNPVIIDSRVARNGGAIFHYQGKVYRPSQRNIDGVYGKALNINKVLELSIDKYEEENYRIFEADNSKGLISMHHLHQLDNMFIFDAAHKII